MHSAPRSDHGSTLLELIVVLMILAAVAGVVVPSLHAAGANGRETATRESLKAVSEAIVGRWREPGYRDDLGRPPETVADLLRPSASLPLPLRSYDPALGRGWRGPYLRHVTGTYTVDGRFLRRYGQDGDPAVLDAWGRPIVLQLPAAGTPAERERSARLVSAGPDGELDTPPDLAEPTAEQRGDDLVLFLHGVSPR